MSRQRKPAAVLRLLTAWRSVVFGGSPVQAFIATGLRRLQHARTARANGPMSDAQLSFLPLLLAGCEKAPLRGQQP
jgi:hypothetical protein